MKRKLRQYKKTIQMQNVFIYFKLKLYGNYYYFVWNKNKVFFVNWSILIYQRYKLWQTFENLRSY